MARVELQGVGKIYDNGVNAVRELDLRIEDGELMVLVGPSGSGKSTVLRLIAGLEEITAGKVTIGDRVVNDLHPKDRDVAMVFQDYALYPHMTVRQNIGFALGLRKMPRADVDRRVREVADLLGVRELLDRRPHALSGGQQQRVALGRAIVRDPAAFLFDEPLSNLDATLRITTRGEIKSLQRRLKATMIYVTHDQEEAMTLGDRVAVICEGRLQQVDAPLHLYRRPANRFVASFIGSPPMNFMDGTIETRDDGHIFVEWGAASDRGAVVALPSRWKETLQPLVGREAVLGARPQAFSEPKGAATGKIEVRIDHIETLGDTMDVIGTTAGGARLVARLPAREQVSTSGPLALRLDTARAHLFEPGPFGDRLLP